MPSSQISPCRSLRIVDAGDGAQGRGLAGAVAAEQGQDFALPDIERHALHDIAFAVIGVDVADREERAGGFDLGGLAVGDVWVSMAMALINALPPR